ncbi:retrovirus-related pol polyprotein from transposon TNT 1-94, partial [Tanacetum coccineum]
STSGTQTDNAPVYDSDGSAEEPFALEMIMLLQFWVSVIFNGEGIDFEMIKSRLVVRGYRQEEGIDFEESFAPVARIKKALYGLKQAPRAWYDELSTFLLQNHFFKVIIDPTLFIRRFDDDILVVQVYVDDIIFGSTHPRYT